MWYRKKGYELAEKMFSERKLLSGVLIFDISLIKSYFKGRNIKIVFTCFSDFAYLPVFAKYTFMHSEFRMVNMMLNKLSLKLKVLRYSQAFNFNTLTATRVNYNSQQFPNFWNGSERVNYL